MKKSSLQSLVNFIDTMDAQGSAPEDVVAIKAEIEAELAKGKAKADANRAIYAEMHDVVMEVLAGAMNPVTAQELADETGFAKGKIVYGLTNYWSAEVTKYPGKTATYSLA